MGTKRVGLARTQALVQNLKRTLTMGGTRFTNVKGLEMEVYSDAIPFDGPGGGGELSDPTGLTVPANSVITGLGCVVITELSLSAGLAKWECLFGTAISGGAGASHDLTDPNDDTLATSAGTVAVGKGTSTHSHETTALGGAAALVFEADIGYGAAERTVYGTITPHLSTISQGAAKFWVTYRLVG